jgi:hypothetical protein
MKSILFVLVMMWSFTLTAQVLEPGLHPRASAVLDVDLEGWRYGGAIGVHWVIFDGIALLIEGGGLVEDKKLVPYLGLSSVYLVGKKRNVLLGIGERVSFVESGVGRIPETTLIGDIGFSPIKGTTVQFGVGNEMRFFTRFTNPDLPLFTPSLSMTLSIDF